MSSHRLVVINAGLGTPSTTRDIAVRVADEAAHGATAAGGDVAVTVLDLRALAGDLATYMTTMIPTAALEDARKAIDGADAVIAATPVFQGSYSGLFKMFFDALDKGALQGVPVTLVATAGTLRHSMVLDYAMRPLLSFLQATVLPTGVFVATEEYGGQADIRPRLERAGAELAAELGAPAGRDRGGVGFEELLRAHSGSSGAGFL